MRILTHAAFVKLPAGTIASEYKPRVFSAPFVKGDTLNPGPEACDFWRSDLLGEIDWHDSDDHGAKLELMETEDVPLTFGYPQTREGWCSPDTLYAVWSGADVQNLIKFLGGHPPGLAELVQGMEELELERQRMFNVWKNGAIKNR